MKASRRPSGGHWIRTAAAMLCALMVMSATVVQARGLVLFGLPDQAATSDLLGALSTLLGAAACLACGLSSHSGVPRGTRSAWVLLGVGLSLWALGDVIWFGYEVVAMEPPYPGPADIFYLMGIPVMGLGLLRLARTAEPVSHDLRLTLDMLVLSSALTLVTYLLVLRTVVDALGLSVQTGISVLYPVSEVVFTALVGVVAVRSRGTRERPDLILLTTAFLVYWAADSYYVVADVTGKDYTQSPFGLGYVAGPLLIGLAAAVAGTIKGRVGGTSGTVIRGLSAVLPDIGVFAALLVCAAAGLRTGVDWVLTASVLGLMAYRQALIATSSQREHRLLAAQVRERTASLQWLSDHHEGILASVGEGVIGVDASGTVTFVNPAATAMLRAGSEVLLGRGGCTITCVDSSERGHRCVLDLVQQTETAVTLIDEEFVRVDGTRVPVEVTATPRRGPGHATGVVLVFRDATERLAMTRMKTEFVSAVSHELRTPLTSIRGALELLNDGATGALPPVANKMIATALRGSERLTRLITDIIDVERFESGSFPMRLADVEVGPLVRTVVADLQALAAASGVTLRVVHATGRARCDADRLVQALVNLVGNAIKFSPPGTTVEISAEPRGKFVHIRVVDSGRGIPASHLELVFERFQQVDAADADEKAGTGLGLPITKSIVEQQGGQIWVTSLPGQGSTFEFTIPLSEESDTLQPVRSAS